MTTDTKIKFSVDKLLSKVFSTTTVVQKFREDGLLHFSSFPFCPLQKLYSYLNNGIFLQQDMPFGMRYYTGVGTAVHTIIQEYVAQSGKVLGDYTCQNPECGCVHKEAKSAVCPECGGYCSYDELDVRFSNNVIGHTDGVYEYMPNKFCVIDYKTSSKDKVEQQNKFGNVYPTLHNKSQIEMYCVAIEKERGITIDGWCLIYLARDNPMRYTATVSGNLSDKRKEILTKKLTKYSKQWTFLRKAETVNDKYFTKLVETKPCKDESHYTQTMFDGYQHCPLKDVCFNEKHLVKEFKVAFVNSNVTLPLNKAFEELEL